MTKLFVGNLPFECDDVDIESFFHGHGIEATDCKVIRDRDTNKSRGFGFATVQQGDGDRAMDLSGTDLTVEGRTRQLTISEAKQTERGRR